MRNYDIIKKVFEITQQQPKGDRWERNWEWEDKIKEIEGLIAKHRPVLIPKDQRKGLK